MSNAVSSVSFERLQFWQISLLVAAFLDQRIDEYIFGAIYLFET